MKSSPRLGRRCSPCRLRATDCDLKCEVRQLTRARAPSAAPAMLRQGRAKDIMNQHSLRWGFSRFSEGTLRSMTVWPSGLRRWLQAPVRKGFQQLSLFPRACGHDSAIYATDTSPMYLTSKALKAS